MSKFLSLTRTIHTDPNPPDIRPVKHPKFKVVESQFDENPMHSFAIVTSDTLYSHEAVIEFIKDKSGLHDDWFVVPGYPYLNEDKLCEWKVTQWKDW